MNPLIEYYRAKKALLDASRIVQVGLYDVAIEEARYEDAFEAKKALQAIDSDIKALTSMLGDR